MALCLEWENNVRFSQRTQGILALGSYGFPPPLQCLLNCFYTDQGLCNVCLHKWWLSLADKCQRNSVSHHAPYYILYFNKKGFCEQVLIPLH